MFRFAHPLYLYLLFLVPLFTAAFVWLRYRRKKNIKRFGDALLVRELMMDVSTWRPYVKFILLMTALVLLVFLMARPQFGTRNEVEKRKGIEAIIAVDVSNSMLCQDVAPSRLDKSKMIVSKLVDKLENDRVGLVAFAGSAITLLPITSDQASAKMFVDQLSPATVSLQGTNVAEAINRATAGFSDRKNVGRALILITDAEDHEDGAIEAAKEAKKKGIRIFVLSVGTQAGGPIPLGGGSYKKDRNGQTVTTQLNEEVGKQIAKAGDGFYVNVNQGSYAEDALMKEVDMMQKDDIMSSYCSEYDEQFVAVAILLLLVLAAECCLMERSNPFFKRFHLFR